MGRFLLPGCSLCLGEATEPCSSLPEPRGTAAATPVQGRPFAASDHAGFDDFYKLQEMKRGGKLRNNTAGATLLREKILREAEALQLVSHRACRVSVTTAPRGPSWLA